MRHACDILLSYKFIKLPKMKIVEFLHAKIPVDLIIPLYKMFPIRTENKSLDFKFLCFVFLSIAQTDRS